MTPTPAVARRPDTPDPLEAADLLVAARAGGPGVDWRSVLPAGRAQAYAVQDATLAKLGPVGAWKVGAKSPEVEPHCAPMPAANLLGSGARLIGPEWRLRGVEVELALRVARDMVSSRHPLAPEQLADVFDAVLPVIEVVETRLADWPGSDPLAKLADLQSHGALVCGTPVVLENPMDRTHLDLRRLQAVLRFDGVPVASTQGGNPAADLWRMLGWLVAHCAQRGAPLRAGTIVATGSCTGLLFAPPGTRVQAELLGLGALDLQF